MRRRKGSSGSGPVPARRFAAMWPGSAVPGIAQVTAGWETTNFSRISAQEAQPISAA